MIRRLQPWEIEDVAPIAKAFCESSGIGRTFDKGVLLDVLHRYSAQGRLYACAFIKDEKVVGALVGILSPHFMSRDVVAQELFWYVLTEQRGGIEGLRLLRDFKAWSKEKKASLFVMATFHQEGANQTLTKLYESQGLKPIETHYLEELTPWQ